MSRGLFVTGTGTDVGKTHITALLIHALRQSGHNAGYYKAAVSGSDYVDGRLNPQDAQRVVDFCRLPGAPMDYVSYCLEEAVSPHLAAKLDGITIDLAHIIAHYRAVSASFDYLTIEGSGGIICPLAWGEAPLLLTDVVQALHLPAVIVAPAGLGTINATMLTVHYLRQLHIPIQAIILNYYDHQQLMHRDNRQMIAQMSGLPVHTCAENAPQVDIDSAILQSYYQPS